MNDPASTKCPFCDKKGLPILPLRPAVARTDFTLFKTLDLPTSFQKGVVNIALPETSAKYTSRLLRGGYLYVFNEKRGEWKAYLVTGKGYLYEFDIHDTTPPDAEKVEFACSRTADALIARCITVSDADAAGKIWLAFSDVAWTADVLKRHKPQAFREKHMHMVDVGAWVGGDTRQPYTAPLAELCEVVNEFTKNGPAAASASDGYTRVEKDPDTGENVRVTVLDEVVVTSCPPFDFSPHEFRGCKNEAEGLLNWATTAAAPYQPMMVCVADPVGIAAELNALVKKLAVEWAEEPERERKHGSALMIGAMREAVERGGEIDEIEHRKTTAGVADAISGLLFGTAYRQIVGRPGEVISRAGRIDEEELAKVHADAWGKYEDMYDEAARRRYLEEEYPAALADYEASTLNPLDAKYLAWIESDSFRQTFICNYDANDCESGFAYTRAMYLVLFDSTGRKAISDYLYDCLQADPALPESIELRALAFNQDTLIAKWADQAASGPRREKGPYGWDNMANTLFSGFKGVLEDAIGGDLSGPFASLTKYAYEFSGPFLRRLNNVFNKATGAVIARLPEKRVIALLGMIAKSENPSMRLVDLRTEPNRKQAVRMLARTVGALSGVDDLALRSVVRQSLDEFFDPLDGKRYPYQGIMLVDETQAKRLAGMRGTQHSAARTELMTTRLLQPEHFSRQMELSVRRLVNLDVKTSFVSAIFAVSSISSAWDDIRKEPGLKSTAGFASGVAALSSALMEGTGAALRATPWGATRLAQPLSIGIERITTRAAALGFAGKLIGAVGGAVAGVLAIWEGWKELGISPVYGGGMMALGLGMLISVILIFSATGPVGFIVAIVIALIMFAVGFLKKDRIQKWLDKTVVFGYDKAGERFDSLELQLSSMEALSAEEN